MRHRPAAFRESAPSPDLGALTAHLWAIALPILIGAAIGALAVFVLERRRRRWSWAFLFAPFAYLLWFAAWQLGLAATVATLAALVLGARRHGEVTQHGGEEAREMRSAPGPLGWALSRLRGRGVRKRRVRVKDGRLAIGSTRGSGPCYIPFGLDRGVHALIVGATGAGKTVTEAALLQAYVGAAFGSIVIDPKPDAFLRASALAAARAAGVRFIEWSPRGSAVYNPLARGGPTEIADKALAAHRWSEPHYELRTRRLLGNVLATLQAAGSWPPSLSTVVEHMDPERLDALASQCGGEIAERITAYVDGLQGQAKAELGGGRDRLAVLADSELAPWLDPSLGAGEQIDLERCLRGADVVYFNLEADRYPAAARLLASALVIDIVGLTASLQDEGVGGLVLIDEFAALAAEHVSRLFARARSAGLNILLGTQSLADLRGARPEDPTDTLTEQVLSNVEVAVVHRIGDPDSAERFARMAGTEPAWTLTQRVSGPGAMIGLGEGTRTREREFLIVPDQFKRLRVGEAIVIDPAARRPAQLASIWPPRDLGAGREAVGASGPPQGAKLG